MIHEIKPLVPVKTEGLEDIAKALLEGRQTPPEGTDEFKGFSITSPKDYILLEGRRSHGSYSYPALLVCKYRLGLTPEVQKAGNRLGLQLQNTGKENNGRDYVGSINWQNALKLNLMIGGETATPREFEDFLILLNSGKAFDGTGKSIARKELSTILDEIMKVRNPYRAEWLDADFKYLDARGNQVTSDKKGDLFINYSHELKNGVLVPRYHEKLEPCVMEDKKIKLASMNRQGMAIEEGNDFSFWYPRSDNNSVARFDAGSDRADLGCGRGADYSYPSLGVRLVVRKKI